MNRAVVERNLVSQPGSYVFDDSFKLSVYRYTPGLVVMRRQLLEQLLDPVLLAHGVDVRDFVVGDLGEVQVDLPEKMEIKRN